MITPKWAQDLILDAILYLRNKGVNAELPDIKWRNTPWFRTFNKEKRESSSGTCYSNYILIRAGTSRIDCELVILHELAHWVLPCRNGHKGHTPYFWDLAWQLYREFKLPIRYCKKREIRYFKGLLGYKSGALAAYRRNCKLH